LNHDAGSNHQSHALTAHRMGIDTHQEPVVYMSRDCGVCRSEGFEAQSRVRIRNGNHAIIATLNIADNELLPPGGAGLSEAAWRLLAVEEGTRIHVSHPRPLRSLSHVRGKIYGNELSREAITEIIEDIVAGRYADVELASFITACALHRMSVAEMVHLTEAMVRAGDRIEWGRRPIMDKHSVGGLPGNRTTMIIVPIVAANGLTMPKTSSRAITSPAGTADAMECLAPVDLSIEQLRRVVDVHGGCIAWGGGVRLSPADDILIRIERALDLDSEGQLVASILSKKVAAGSTHVVLDMPVGPTAKVRDANLAAALSAVLIDVGRSVGLEVEVVTTDGSQPVGRGIGPALEARDVLAVLRGAPDAPPDLREKGVLLAGHVLELSGVVREGEGVLIAERSLAGGAALAKFLAICEAQGGFREPPIAPHRVAVEAPREGVVSSIDNRRLARVAKLAGAPSDLVAGLDLHVRLGAQVRAGDPLYTIHAESPGELAYARQYVLSGPDPIAIEDA
jgi:thymidine phosphorylase